MSQPHLSWQDAAASGDAAGSGSSGSGKRRVSSGGPMSYTVSGVADSANPTIDVGDFTLNVKVSGLAKKVVSLLQSSYCLGYGGT